MNARLAARLSQKKPPTVTDIDMSPEADRAAQVKHTRALHIAYIALLTYVGFLFTQDLDAFVQSICATALVVGAVFLGYSMRMHDEEKQLNKSDKKETP